jgi:hypothetical protein
MIWNRASRLGSVSLEKPSGADLYIQQLEEEITKLKAESVGKEWGEYVRGLNRAIEIIDERRKTEEYVFAEHSGILDIRDAIKAEIVTNTYATLIDAEQTARAMRDGLERLKTKYGVGADEEEAPPPAEPTT